VLATDGRVYDNPCLARMAGASVVRRVPPRKLAGLGSVFSGVSNTVVFGAFGIGLYLLLRPKRR
jgi:hypothetical protein